MTSASTNTISLIDSAIFTGTEMYQALRKQTEYKDHSHYEFELQREKRLEALRKFGDGQLLNGPQMDLAGSYLCYQCAQVDKDHRASSHNLQRTLVGKFHQF